MLITNQPLLYVRRHKLQVPCSIIPPTLNYNTRFIYLKSIVISCIQRKNDELINAFNKSMTNMIYSYSTNIINVKIWEDVCLFYFHPKTTEQ